MSVTHARNKQKVTVHNEVHQKVIYTHSTWVYAYLFADSSHLGFGLVLGQSTQVQYINWMIYLIFQAV